MLRLFDKRLLGILLLASVVGACDDTATPVTPTPADPKTETFTGSITQNGASTHDFAVSAGGAVTATLKAIGTDNTLVVGFSVGNWNSTASSCSIILANDAATAGAFHSGTMTAVGSLCVRIYDVGNIVAGTAVTYTIEVVHP
jgi:hypothetical protein